MSERNTFNNNMGQTMSASSDMSNNVTIEQVIELFVDLGDMLSMLNGSKEQR